MATNEPTGHNTSQQRCPVCWTWFTTNSPTNPAPRQYCCGACRIEAFHTAGAALALVMLSCGPIGLTLPHERDI